MTATNRGRIGALQVGTDPAGTAATLEKLIARTKELKERRLQLLVMPEALLGGYPKGADFGTRVGYRTMAGREAFRKYWAQAIDIPGHETAALGELARNAGTALVVGAVERKGASLYCVALMIDKTGELAAVHRKIVPTAMERIIWAQGDLDGPLTMETDVGRVGSAICWENYMPLFRSTMYAKQLSIWCAPTVDDREVWASSMRHIAVESRCFVVSACQFSENSERVLDESVTLRERPADKPIIRGGSCIVSPLGEVLAGPVYDGEELISADIDPDDIVRARFDLDVVGHYDRKDLFELRQK